MKQMWFETDMDSLKTRKAIHDSDHFSSPTDPEKGKGFFMTESKELGCKLQIYYSSGKIFVSYPDIETLEKLYQRLSPLTRREDSKPATWHLSKVELEKLASEIGAFFKLFWGKGVVEIDKSDFFETVQRPIKNHLNQDLSTGEFCDPILSLYLCDASCLLEDARLAKERGHFLTVNHRDILNRIDKVSEDELVKHNYQWAKRFESAYIEREEEPGAERWRLNPQALVIHELFLRRRELEETCLGYYKRFDKGEFTLHDIYEESVRWPIDLKLATKNFEERMKERIVQLSAEERELHDLISRLRQREGRSDATTGWIFYHTLLR